MVPAFVADRIRKPAPAGCDVVVGSTPVVSFGDFTRARVATVAINPSSKEFLGRDGRLRAGDSRRLSTLHSLKCEDLASASDDTVGSVWSDCCRYFDVKPYKGWFNHLERFLKAIGASYYDGTACHLDLSPWATRQSWNSVPQDQKRSLIEDGTEFLHQQLNSKNIEVVLVSGKAAKDELESLGALEIDRSERVSINSRNTTEFFEGRLFGSKKCVGWSMNVQRAGVSEENRSVLQRKLKASTSR